MSRLSHRQPPDKQSRTRDRTREQRAHAMSRVGWKRRIGDHAEQKLFDLGLTGGDGCDVAQGENRLVWDAEIREFFFAPLEAVHEDNDLEDLESLLGGGLKRSQGRSALRPQI